MIDMHLNPVAAADAVDLTTLPGAKVGEACRHYGPELAREGIERAVMVVLSDAALEGLEEEAGSVGSSVSRTDAASASEASVVSGFSRTRFPIALAIDFRGPDAEGRLERAHAAGVAALKFHPYLQQIVPADYARAAALSRAAERLGMFVMVCCSYGTRALERHDGVRLAARLAGDVRCPIVMSHGGGRQVLDAMLVAADAPQVLLETSFSLPYYVGSSIDTDFAFAIRKLGASRWMFGSDAPFVPLGASIARTREFFDRHHFTAAEAEQIFHATAAALLEDR
jgi:predicted TIM-barrel fold metal-dependent hydrolase